ncbi:phage conserved hypothetical protein BR0599 [Lysobacter sp. yr284]|uniref:phage BR0599 family protein n=1 Tax=Lysobacter sp. yr284 TaxID=1761791 RepID=UPI0008984D88|nr:phage BR0599 family protein [Lysobacter sp. yr284]SDY64994.1 phage conserved hypothetical protein BR0599 [Lysobacter sp. yr284]
MSFDQYERSTAAGNPRRLYEFVRGGQRWRYTGGDRDFQLDTQTYRAVAISDDGIRQSGHVASDVLTITAPGDFDVARLYRGLPPSTEVAVFVRDIHEGDSEARVAWVGRVAGVNRPKLETSEIRCQSLDAALGQPGLRLAWTRGCPYTLYDRNCRVNPEAHRVPATLATVAGNVVTAGAFGLLPDGWLAGGFLAWDLGEAGIERRGIRFHEGERLILLGAGDGLRVGQALVAYPGCARTIAICHSKFANAPNYGGVPGLPGKSPFDGTPVF